MKTLRVAAAVIVRDGRVLAARRGSGKWKDRWEFPGGKLEEGETARKALSRELREELALDAPAGTLLATIERDYPDFRLVMDCFSVDIGAQEPRLLEHAEVRFLGPGELGSVDWLPADRELLPVVRPLLESI